MSDRRTIAAALIATILAGCSSPVYVVTPRDWSTPAARDSVLNIYRPFLQGHALFLDPGHGGDDRVSHGPAGDAVEADVNLRVALALRSLLLRAGATVVMSRDRDTTIALGDRAVLATRAGAELFISLHHNATGTGDDLTNYSSVYYHARPGLPGYHPANHDIARYIQRDMSYAMRNPSSPSSPTFDGTLSDFDIYPNSGFAVLHAATMPAVLIEGSFFTHPHEERRLVLEEFNRIEAWGVFLGVGRYFRTGFPRLALASDTLLSPRWDPVAIVIGGAVPPDPATIDVRVDQKPVRIAYDTIARTITAFPDTNLTSGIHTLSAVVGSTGGNSSWPFTRSLLVMLPAESLAIACAPGEFPGSGDGEVRLTCMVTDRNAMPVADGMSVRIEGPGIDTTIATNSGRAFAYVRPAAGQGPGVFSVTCGRCTTSVALRRAADARTWCGGQVRGEDDSLALSGVEVRALDSAGTVLASDSTMADGKFGVLIDETRTTDLEVRKGGFCTSRVGLVTGTPAAPRDVALRPVAGRLLFGKVILVDPRYGGQERGDCDSLGLCGAAANLEIALRAVALLRAAGAHAVLVRSSDSTIAESARARFSASFGRGMYLRIDAGGQAGRASCTVYPSPANRQFAGSLLSGARLVAELDSTGILSVRDRFHTEVALGTVTLVLPSPRTGAYRSGEKAFDDAAWGIFVGTLAAEGFVPDATDRQIARDPVTGLPRPGAAVVCGGSMVRIAGPGGEAIFYGVGKQIRSEANAEKRGE